MTDLDWPFYEPHHREVAQWADDWCAANPPDHGTDVDAACRALVASLGATPLLQIVAPSDSDGYPVRSIALVRERLAYHSGLADFAFAMQGLGLGPIVAAGSDEQTLEWGGKVARGEAIAAFALTEPETGSDAANIAMTGRRDGEDWALDGEKTYISNGTIADFLTVFARTGEGDGARGISAFLVRGDAPGLSIAERIEVIAPHPLARLRFAGVRAELIGQPGKGFRIAMQTLNVFRVGVGAAALGFARRALDEAVAFSSTRRLGAGTLADNAVTQAKLADMAVAIDSAALLVARAAWQQYTQKRDNRCAAAMAKLHATEAAQQVIDAAVQMHGGAGVTRGVKVEELYRDIRALRIYEGASEVQRQIVARDLLKEHAG
ncbi:MAG: acyl-CoA dehydrogenase family protein [Sphingomonas sp.]|nr:acyl-CoA dehydrogenase family protein [Sphingomonas sp.]